MSSSYRRNSGGFLLPNIKRFFAGPFLALVAAGHTSVAQTSMHAQNPPAVPAREAANPCAQPGRLFSADDYEGPLKKAVTYFSRKLEIKTVHGPHYKPGRKPCSLSPAEKFRLFLRNTIEPVTFIGAGFNAGVDQPNNSDPAFGQGMAGYGKRYGAALADAAANDFFHT